MASDGSDQDARYALSKLLQRGTVTEYESGFLMLIKRVTGISESLLKSFYISGLKPLLQCALLRLAPTTLGEAFSIARIMEAQAPPVIKVSLDANEDIGVVEVRSAIDDVFDIGESNVESMEVRSEFSEFSKNKESVEEVVVGGGEACKVGEDELNRVISALEDEGGECDGRLDEINLNLSEELADNGVSHIPTSLVAHESSRARQLWERIGIGDAHGLRDNGRNHKFVQPNVWEWMSDSQWAYSSYHLEGKVIFEGVGSVTAWVAEGGRMVLCYVQGSERRKRKKGVGCGSGRQENYGSGRRDCSRIRIWDTGIKIYFRHHLEDKVVVKEWGLIRPRNNYRVFKIKWAVEGEENSGFFHGIINKRRSIQSIRGVMVEGTWIDNPVNVKKEFLDHFANRFSKPGTPAASLLLDFPKQISHDQRLNLESEVTNVEIKKAVWECGMDKAPGPDGFTFRFFRHFWYLVERDVYEAVRYFFLYSDLPKGCNSSFIALIPKIPDANLVKDFRPISLIGSIYKIIAKNLTNRLVGVLGEEKKAMLMFKVELRKPYDRSMDFLDDVLSKFGFGEKWRKWIHCCLHSSKGSIIINGSPTDEFQFGKGLKQGDPLSPFLFLLIMESLHISFQRVVDAGMRESNLSSLVHVLDCFHKVSGLKINMNKSKNMGIEVDSGRVSSAVFKLGCLVFKTQFLISWILRGEKCIDFNLGMILFDRVLSTLRTLESIRGKFFNGHETSIGVLSHDSPLGLVIKAIHRPREHDGYSRNGANSCWVNIINEIKVLAKKGINLMNFMRMKLGNGVSTLFLDDGWCESGRLKVRFPRAYALETCKRITVGNKLGHHI
ncbi:RNA-directed DNA polymerase, eukaryota [Tanacetum coccineum]